MMIFADHIHNFMQCSFNYRIVSFSLLILGIVVSECIFAQDLYVGAQGGLAWSDLPSSISDYRQFETTRFKSLAGGFEINYSFGKKFYLGSYFNHLSYDVGYEYPYEGIEKTVSWIIYSDLLNEVGINGGLDLQIRTSRFGCMIGTGVGVITGWGSGYSWTKHTDSSYALEAITTTGFPKMKMTYYLRATPYYQFTNGIRIMIGPSYSTCLGSTGQTTFSLYDISNNLLERWQSEIRPSSIRFLVGLHYPISRIWRGKPSQP